MPIQPPQDNLVKPGRAGCFKFLSLPDGGRFHPMALPLLSRVWSFQLPHLQNESQLFSLSRLLLSSRYKSLAALSSSACPPYFSPNSLHRLSLAFSFSIPTPGTTAVFLFMVALLFCGSASVFHIRAPSREADDVLPSTHSLIAQLSWLQRLQQAQVYIFFDWQSSCMTSYICWLQGHFPTS